MNSDILNKIFSDFYRSSGLNKAELEKTVNQNVIKSYDAYILPLKLSNEEKCVKTQIGAIIRHPVPAVVHPLFPVQMLQEVLNLQPPKKVIAYSGPSHAEAPIVKEKPKRSHGRSRASRNRLSREAPSEVASIYAEEESKPAVNRAAQNKRQKVNKEENEMVVENDYHNGREEEHEEVQHNISRIPGNFYDVATEVFNSFWHLEFEDQEINFAFFAKITSINCKDFKLEAFADTSSSLAVIREKLEGKQYLSAEEFVYDFHQMFDNIFLYYTSNHPAYKKAIELSVAFEERWKVAQPTLK